MSSMTKAVFGEKEAAHYLRAVARQMPFAMALGLNATGDFAQSAIKAQVGRSFTLRQAAFSRNTIVRLKGEGDFATKRKPSATIRIDSRTDSKGSKRDYLAKFVAGGVKRPTSGRTVAVPVNAPRNAAGIITRSNRPKALQGKKGYERIATDRGKDFLVRFSGRGKRGRLTVLYALKPSVPIRAQFPMFRVAEQAVNASWHDAVANGIDTALRTAK